MAEPVLKYEQFANYIVGAPLYRQVRIENPRVQNVPEQLIVPEIVENHCRKCGSTQKWQRKSSNTIAAGFHNLIYVCRNCQEVLLTVWLYLVSVKAGEAVIVKAGQYPKLLISIPKEFEKALGNRADLYLKGMTSRHSGYGIGAVSYFRRLIEDTTDEMLDLLGQAMKETRADPKLLEELERAKGGKVFEDKVKKAADVIPAPLRPGGINPFQDLYDLLSISLHGLDDDACCDIVDGMDQALKFIYTQLKTHAEDAKAYEEAVKTMHAKLDRLKKGQ